MSRPPLTPASVVSDAAQLADQVGLDAVTLSAVATRLGVRTPSLYSHVRDLSALRDGVTALALQELADRISAEIAGRSGRIALVGFARAHREFARSHPGRWQALQRRAGADAVLSPSARNLVALNKAVLAGYGLDDSVSVHAIRLVGSTINGFLNLERVGNFDHSTPAAEESWDVAIDALDGILSTWPTSADHPDHPDHSQGTPS